MKIALGLGLSEEATQFARQLGVRHAVWGMGELPPDATHVALDVLLRARELFADAGLELDVLEGFSHTFYHKAMLGQPGREEEIDRVCQSITNMGRAGIHVLSYQWMPLGGLTTDVVRGRGAPAPPTGSTYRLPEREEVWEHLTYFLERVVPVAEEAGVGLAMHPDDPPIASFLGMERILYDLEGLQRLVDTVPSPSNGLNFCQGCVSEMAGVDVVEAIRRFGAQGKILFAHFRDTRGTVPRFDEVFMDEGDTDMFAAMLAYRDVGVDVYLRADHSPRVVGDNTRADRGFAFQIGYMKGLAQAVDALPAGAAGGD